MRRNQYVLRTLPDGLVIVIIHGRTCTNSSVIDNDVDAAKVLSDFRYDTFDGLPIRNIKGPSSHRVTGFADFFNDLLQRIFVNIGYRHQRPLLSEQASS